MDAPSPPSGSSSGRAYVHPNWAKRVIGARMARLFKPKIVARLTVPGRTSGVDRTNSVAVLEHGGAQYLVAAYGDTEWSRNLRVARRGTIVLGRRGGERPFTADEVAVEHRPDLLAAYLSKFGGLPTVAATFEKLPDPADHPVFRLTFAAT